MSRHRAGHAVARNRVASATRSRGGIDDVAVRLQPGRVGASVGVVRAHSSRRRRRGGIARTVGGVARRILLRGRVERRLRDDAAFDGNSMLRVRRRGIRRGSGVHHPDAHAGTDSDGCRRR